MRKTKSVFNPIGHFGWELKAFVRRFKPKDSDSIQQLVELGIWLNLSHHCKNYFTHCCYYARLHLTRNRSWSPPARCHLPQRRQATRSMLTQPVRHGRTMAATHLV